MYKNRLFILLIFVCLKCGGLQAQDLHFSQAQLFPTQLNPGLTGFIPGEDHRRFTVIHRNQWNSFLKDASFHTTGVALDMRNCLTGTTNKRFNGSRNKVNGPTWGLGMAYLHDESGTRSVKGISDQSYSLLRDHLNVSAAVILPVNDQTYLTGGFRFGGIFNRIETNHLRYDEQFDGLAGYDPSIAGEFSDMDQLKSNLFSIGSGFSVFYLNRSWGLNFGTAFDHIFTPVEYDFVASDNQPVLSKKYTVHGKFSYIFHKSKSNNFGVNLKALLMHQAPYQQVVSGADFFIQNGADLTFTFGAGLRSTRHVSKSTATDAILASMTLNYKAYTFGFNYDFNVSSLEQASNNFGAFEFSLIYRWRNKKSKCAPTLEGCKLDGKNLHPVFI